MRTLSSLTSEFKLKGTAHGVIVVRGSDALTEEVAGQQTPGIKISEARAISVDRKGNIIITENDYGYIREIAHVGPNS